VLRAAPLLFALLAAPFALACKPTDGASAKDAAPPAASSGATAAGGLAAPDADKSVAELAQHALSCHWDRDGLTSDCAAALEWRDATVGFAGGRADPTLVDMLEDRDERIRWLGATKLVTSGKAYRTSKPLAERVVAAAEREKSDRLGGPLGEALARVDVQATGTFDRVRAMVVRHELPSLRAALVAHLLRHNGSSAGTYEVTREMVHDADPAVRLAAVNAFWMGGGKRPDDTCKVWQAATASDDDDVAAQSSENLAHFGQCQAAYPGLLDGEDARRKAAKTTRPRFASALGYLCLDEKATADQRARATTILRAVAELELLQPAVRGAGLEAVLKCDPSGGKAYVQKFTGDEQQAQLRAIATSLLRPPTGGR
jgi:hypothetical protein